MVFRAAYSLVWTTLTADQEMCYTFMLSLSEHIKIQHHLKALDFTFALVTIFKIKLLFGRRTILDLYIRLMVYLKMLSGMRATLIQTDSLKI